MAAGPRDELRALGGTAAPPLGRNAQFNLGVIYATGQAF